MPRNELKKLPTDVKTLVNDGVYSLYVVKDLPGVAYVLLTNTRETIALSEDGDIVSGVSIPLDEMTLGDPTDFPGLDARPASKLNYHTT